MSDQHIITGTPEGGVRRWQAPAVDQPDHPRPSAGPPPAQPEPVKREPTPPRLTIEQIERIQQEAREEGFKAGQEEGFAQGREEGLAQGREKGRREGAVAVRAEAENLRKVLDSLVSVTEQLDHQLEQELVALAITVARHLVRRELRIDPGQVVATVREALAVLPSANRRVQLHLHPDDARIVREILHLTDSEQPWKVIEDPTLSRGGARLETDNSRVDATVESRLNAVIAAMWGGERRDDELETDSGGTEGNQGMDRS